MFGVATSNYRIHFLEELALAFLILLKIPENCLGDLFIALLSIVHLLRQPRRLDLVARCIDQFLFL